MADLWRAVGLSLTQPGFCLEMLDLGCAAILFANVNNYNHRLLAYMKGSFNVMERTPLFLNGWPTCWCFGRSLKIPIQPGCRGSLLRKRQQKITVVCTGIKGISGHS